LYKLRAAALTCYLNSKPWAPAHTGKGAASRRRPLDPRAFKLRAVAGGRDVFQEHLFSTAKCRRLGGAFAAGFKPQVLNLLLSAIFERGLEASQPCRFRGDFCFIHIA